MANSNDYFNTNANAGYEDGYEDEFSHDYEEDELKSKRSFKMPKLSKGGSGSSSGSGLSSLIVPLAVVLCLIMSILCFSAVKSVKANATANYDMLKAELQTVKQANSEILAHLAAVEAGLDNTANVIAGSTSSKYIQITKQPTSTPTTVGRDAAIIFSISATGNNLKMTWQKYDSVSGEWINIVFDLDGNNAEMGIRLYDDSYHGYSELNAKNLTAKAFGTYRCVITDNVGSEVVSDVVEISEKTAE